MAEEVARLTRNQVYDVLIYAGYSMEDIDGRTQAWLDRRLRSMEDEGRIPDPPKCGPTLQRVLNYVLTCVDDDIEIEIVDVDEPEALLLGVKPNPFDPERRWQKERDFDLTKITKAIYDEITETHREELRNIERRMKKRSQAAMVPRVPGGARKPQTMFEVQPPDPLQLKNLGRLRRSRTYYAGEAIAILGVDAPMEDLIRYVDVAFGKVNERTSESMVRHALAALMGFANKARQHNKQVSEDE